MVTFEPLPEADFSPRRRVLDLLLRGLYGWREGLSGMAIDAPWRHVSPHDASLSPDPTFAAWRGLAEALRGRSFAGELPIAEGVHCWMMQGPTPEENALVVWSDRRAGDSPTRPNSCWPSSPCG